MKVKSGILFLCGVSYVTSQNVVMRFYDSDNCTGNYGVSRGGPIGSCISIRSTGNTYSSVTKSSSISGVGIAAYAFWGDNDCGVFSLQHPVVQAMPVPSRQQLQLITELFAAIPVGAGPRLIQQWLRQRIPHWIFI